MPAGVEEKVEVNKLFTELRQMMRQTPAEVDKENNLLNNPSRNLISEANDLGARLRDAEVNNADGVVDAFKHSVAVALDSEPDETKAYKDLNDALKKLKDDLLKNMVPDAAPAAEKEAAKARLDGLLGENFKSADNLVKTSEETLSFHKEWLSDLNIRAAAQRMPAEGQLPKLNSERERDYHRLKIEKNHLKEADKALEKIRRAHPAKIHSQMLALQENFHSATQGMDPKSDDYQTHVKNFNAESAKLNVESSPEYQAALNTVITANMAVRRAEIAAETPMSVPRDPNAVTYIAPEEASGRLGRAWEDFKAGAVDFAKEHLPLTDSLTRSQRKNIVWEVDDYLPKAWEKRPDEKLNLGARLSISNKAANEFFDNRADTALEARIRAIRDKVTERRGQGASCHFKNKTWPDLMISVSPEGNCSVMGKKGGFLFNQDTMDRKNSFGALYDFMEMLHTAMGNPLGPKNALLIYLEIPDQQRGGPYEIKNSDLNDLRTGLLAGFARGMNGNPHYQTRLDDATVRALEHQIELRAAKQWGIMGGLGGDSRAIEKIKEVLALNDRLKNEYKEKYEKTAKQDQAADEGLKNQTPPADLKDELLKLETPADNKKPPIPDSSEAGGGGLSEEKAELKDQVAPITGWRQNCAFEAFARFILSNQDAFLPAVQDKILNTFNDFYAGDNDLLKVKSYRSLVDKLNEMRSSDAEHVLGVALRDSFTKIDAFKGFLIGDADAMPVNIMQALGKEFQVNIEHYEGIKDEKNEYVHVERKPFNDIDYVDDDPQATMKVVFIEGRAKDVGHFELIVENPGMLEKSKRDFDSPEPSIIADAMEPNALADGSFKKAVLYDIYKDALTEDRADAIDAIGRPAPEMPHM